MKKFDLIVIGSGPGGMAAAMRALDFGKNICIVEKNEIGGAGIMHGALTSKTMWELSSDYSVAANITRGYRASGLSVDYEKVKKSVIQAAKEKQYHILSQIETYAPEKNKNGSITLKYGTAKFIDEKKIELTCNEKTEILSSDNFVIATGARPRQLAGYKIDQEKIYDSDGILNLKKFPERMLIIGSGIIGCEFATIFSNYKQTEVHLLDRTNLVLPFEDEDVSLSVSEKLESNGVKIHYTASLREIRYKKDYLEVILDYKDGRSRVLEVDIALIAIGRIPNSENLGLENIGITPNERGFLPIDETCKILGHKDKSIYAVGDITGNLQLYSVAQLQGRYAARAIFDKIENPISYNNLSTLMFFKPEVAAVGMNEKMLREKNIAYKMVCYSNKLVSRTIAMRNTTGFVKIMLSDDGEERILGMRAGGPQASAFIVTVAHLINTGNSLKEIMKVPHPHPSVTEGLQECMRVFNNRSFYKPNVFPEYIKTGSWKPTDK